jgi:hypothetical protein
MDLNKLGTENLDIYLNMHSKEKTESGEVVYNQMQKK